LYVATHAVVFLFLTKQKIWFNREAVRWYRMADQQGSAIAQSDLGQMYGKGEGLPRNFVTAHRCSFCTG
tara:strand:+ start:114 stop:320 length:207 start_codon:yes stop_codon:yes gene_type:complete